MKDNEKEKENENEAVPDTEVQEVAENAYAEDFYLNPEIAFEMSDANYSGFIVFATIQSRKFSKLNSYVSF